MVAGEATVYAIATSIHEMLNGSPFFDGRNVVIGEDCFDRRPSFPFFVVAHTTSTRHRLVILVSHVDHRCRSWGVRSVTPARAARQVWCVFHFNVHCNRSSPDRRSYEYGQKPLGSQRERMGIFSGSGFNTIVRRNKKAEILKKRLKVSLEDRTPRQSKKSYTGANASVDHRANLLEVIVIRTALHWTRNPRLCQRFHLSSIYLWVPMEQNSEVTPYASFLPKRYCFYKHSGNTLCRRKGRYPFSLSRPSVRCFSSILGGITVS
jgi:hypothetical protein